jgi:hypothetical protein
MKIIKQISMTVFITLSFIGCDVATQIMTDYEKPTSSNTKPSESEVTTGLKRALQIGAETAVANLGITDAFYKNAAYKILLPSEAQAIVKHKDNPLLQAAGIDKLIDDAEKSMNRAAEQAVIKAKPIFVEAITKMTIEDAFGILNGSDTAASHYLREKTYQNLYHSFKPEVSKTLEQPIYKGISTKKSWSELTKAYNTIANFNPSWETVNTELDDYVTEKALHALFEEVKKEELKIRKDPAARVEEILRKVFGS